MPIGFLLLCLLAGCQSGALRSASIPPASQAQHPEPKTLPPVLFGSFLGPVQDVRFLEKDASVIVTGRVLNIRTVGMTEMIGVMTPRLATTVQVDRVLKGKVKGKKITIRYPRDPLPSGLRLKPGLYALYFLKQGQGDTYTLVNPMIGKMNITSRSVPWADAAGTPMGKLKAELFTSLSDPSPEVAKTALKQVGYVGKERSVETLLRVAESRNPENRGMAYAGLLCLGNYSLLRQTIRFAQAPTSDPNAQYWKSRVAASIGVIGNNRLIQSWEAVHYNRTVTCPSKVKSLPPFPRSVLFQLYPLVSSGDVELRRAAVHALRGICVPSSARYMAQALNDKDRVVQYYAVIGLASLEGATSYPPKPTESKFDEDPSRYLAFWKNWWESTGEEKYASQR